LSINDHLVGLRKKDTDLNSI